MRLYEKAILIYGGFMVTGLAIGTLVLSTPLRNSIVGIILSFLPVVVFSQLVRRFLVCPHCGKSATQLPNFFSTPWVGGKCRYCGKDY